MKRSILTLLTLALALPALGDQTVGMGTPYWARTQALTTTPACIIARDGNAKCALFPAGKGLAHAYKAIVAQQLGTDGVRCMFTGDLALTVVGNTVTSGGATRTGAPVLLPANGSRADIQASREEDRTAAVPGAFDGLCTNTSSATGGGAGDLLYAPCNADADCTGYGGGTCDATPTPEQISAASRILFCWGVSGTPSVDIRKESVRH